MRCSSIHPRVIFTWTCNMSILKLCSKFIRWKWQPHRLKLKRDLGVLNGYILEPLSIHSSTLRMFIQTRNTGALRILWPSSQRGLTPNVWRIATRWPGCLLDKDHATASGWGQSFADVIEWVSCQIRKTAGCECTGNAGNVFPATDFKGNRVTQVPWCMSVSLTHGGGENVPGIPGACASRNFSYLARNPFNYALVNRRFN